ncbi:MAG: hypothetical protein AAF191_09245, partial [Verrucomicrobiota bacterium]
EEWRAAMAEAEHVIIEDGLIKSETAEDGVFTSILKTYPEPRSLQAVQFEQSPVWNNWEQIEDITPPGLGNAYVFLPVAPGDYYVFATFQGPPIKYPEGLDRKERRDFKKKYLEEHPQSARAKGYHAWHSTDLKEWEHLGQVCESNWVTTAEYADGKFYLYYDAPNDQDPHLVVDDDLTDGVPGEDHGKVFDDPTHGSDCGVFRDEDGTFHMIYEDWSPINARQNAWDSPLAGRVSSEDGIHGFTFGEHPAAVDHRTKPTGETGTYEHTSMKAVNEGKPLEYEIHEPKQEAYGDWTMIKVGRYYHLFCDYDPADHEKSMRMGRFSTDDLDQEFSWSGEIGAGFHPDPSVGFAEGKFYAIMQKETDFVSPGPWVDAVKARAGVDIDGDGTIDEWTEWQPVKETYAQKPGFARVVDVEPAVLDASGLSAGTGFQFQFRTGSVANGVQPEMDRVELRFDGPARGPR